MSKRVALFLIAILLSTNVAWAEDCHYYKTSELSCGISICIKTEKRNIGNLWLFPKRFVCFFDSKDVFCEKI